MRNNLVVSCLMAASFNLQTPLWACHDGSPLILDLNGDGIGTTTLSEPVSFDLDGDGFSEAVAWTNAETEEAFVWLDLNGNGRADSGRELFGDATVLPWGDPAENGFVALAAYDLLDMGGNDDGLISKEDDIWKDLRLWIDRNHDGATQAQEVRTLASYQITALLLEYDHVEGLDALDESMNRHAFVGAYWRRVTTPGSGVAEVARPLHDVYFRVAHDE